LGSRELESSVVAHIDVGFPILLAGSNPALSASEQIAYALMGEVSKSVKEFIINKIQY